MGQPGTNFGPLQFVHTTYACDIKFNYADESQRDGWLSVTEDIVYYDGVYYGDRSVNPGAEGSRRYPPLIAKARIKVPPEKSVEVNSPRAAQEAIDSVGIAPPLRR